MARERELRRLGAVTREHQEKLRKVQTAIEASLGEQYDRTLAPLQLRVEPHESLGILQLVHTPNKVQVLVTWCTLVCAPVGVCVCMCVRTLCLYGKRTQVMNKVLLAFSSLCSEVDVLLREVSRVGRAGPAHTPYVPDGRAFSLSLCVCVCVLGT
jgi:hypothetical protein